MGCFAVDSRAFGICIIFSLHPSQKIMQDIQMMNILAALPLPVSGCRFQVGDWMRC